MKLLGIYTCIAFIGGFIAASLLFIGRTTLRPAEEVHLAMSVDPISKRCLYVSAISPLTEMNNSVPRVATSSNKGTRNMTAASPTAPHLTIPDNNKNTSKTWDMNESLQNHRIYTRVKYWLPSKAIYRIKKFVVFMGDVRSGSSIIGTLMDAHPHVLVSNEYRLFNQFWELDLAPDYTWKKNLFNKIYTRSKQDARKGGSRSGTGKGYKLKVDGQWQGGYDRWIEVIGDKSADITIKAYLADKEAFLRNYKKLIDKTSIPVLVINTVRNPFDIMATNMAIMGGESLSKFRKLKSTFQSADSESKGGKGVQKMNDKVQIERQINGYFIMLHPVMELISTFGRGNVLDVHNCDLVNDPRGTMRRIFDFLDVDTTEHYLDVCAEKVFKSESRSRNMVVWTPEQIEMVEKRMKRYEILNRYNFTSE